MRNLIFTHWFGRAAIMALFMAACAAAISLGLGAAGCFGPAPDTSGSKGRGAWYAEKTRLLARIRQAGLRHRILDEVIEKLIEIFFDDVDLQRVAEPEDGFRVYYDEMAGGRTGILFASQTYDHQTKSFYQFADTDGVVGYYDENGRSARKKLKRNPVEAGVLYYEVVLTPLLASAHVQAGKSELAIELLERVRQIGERMNMGNMRPLILGELSEATFAIGDLDRANDLALETIEITRAQHQRGFEAGLLKLLAKIANRRSEDALAERLCNESLRAAAECGMRNAIRLPALTRVWRNGGVHSHDMPPFRFLPSPTLADSSRLCLNSVRYPDQSHGIADC